MRSASYEASMTTLSLVRGQATTYTLLSMGPRVSLVTCISVPYMLACSSQPSASGSHANKYTRQSSRRLMRRGDDVLARPQRTADTWRLRHGGCGPSAHGARS